MERKKIIGMGGYDHIIQARGTIKRFKIKKILALSYLDEWLSSILIQGLPLFSVSFISFCLFLERLRKMKVESRNLMWVKTFITMKHFSLIMYLVLLHKNEPLLNS